MRKRSLQRLGATVTLLGLVSAAAQAGTAVITGQNGGVQFEYQGDQLRVDMPQGQGYMLRKGAEVYVVSNSNGQLMVIDARQAMGMIKGMGMSAATAPEMLNGEVVSLKPTGIKETVAGISGEVYSFVFRDDKGQEQTADMVLSSDARAREFSDAIQGMAEAFAGAMAVDTKASKDFQKRLSDLKLGVLRYGTEMTVTEITADKVADARFVLPAKPLDMSILQGVFGGAAAAPTSSGTSNSSSNAAVDSIGEQTERQQERIEQRTDQEVDDAVDSTVDKALDKVFGKLFGR